MLLPKIAATLWLVICGVLGFEIKVDDSLDSSNDSPIYETNYEGFVEINLKMPSDTLSPRQIHQTTSEHYSSSSNNTGDEEDAFDSWSVVWYVASFGGLIGFFLVVSCSEWCCRKHIRESQTRRTPVPAAVAPPAVSETPPPAYDLFAPPSYESLTSSPNSEKNEYDIYVVPVHAIGSLMDSDNPREENPPSYSSINVTEPQATGTTPRS